MVDRRPSAVTELESEPEFVDVPSLSAIDWILAVEESFGCRFGDDEREKVRSIGDLKRLVESKAHLIPAMRCATQEAFYRLRRAACADPDVPRSAIRPGTRWDELPERSSLRIAQRCRRLAARHGSDSREADGKASVVSLAASLFAVIFLFGALVVLPIAVLALVLLTLLEFRDRLEPPELIGTLVLLGVTALGFWTFNSWLFPAPRPPLRRSTVGESARLLAALESPEPTPGKRSWTRQEISLTVDRLFVPATGVLDFTDRSIPVD